MIMNTASIANIVILVTILAILVIVRLAIMIIVVSKKTNDYKNSSTRHCNKNMLGMMVEQWR